MVKKLDLPLFIIPSFSPPTIESLHFRLPYICRRSSGLNTLFVIGDLRMRKKTRGEPTPPELMVKMAEKLKPSSDVMQIPLQIERKSAILLYIKTVVDGARLQDSIIKPFFELSSEEHFIAYINSLPNKIDLPSQEQLSIDITTGNVLVAVQDQLFLLDFRQVNTDVVHEAILEPTIHGPQFGLSEDLETNINLIRQRFHNDSLKILTPKLKDRTNRPIAILYDETVVRTDALDQINSKLDKLDMPVIQTSADLQLYLNDSKFSLFPSTILTERPDRIVYNLDSGKIILLVDGSPHAVLAPVIFFDFMVSMEDNYHTFWISRLTILLRYFGLFTCILLPALYVAITSYSPDVFRTELALTVAGSRIGVPYPSFIEVLFMLTFIEFLTEASARLPKAISATATTVGGLILGTAITEASLASNIMIIVVALVAIATFIIPVNEMGFAVRVCRVALLISTSLFGLAGLILSFLGIIMYLVDKESFGETYLRIYWKSQKRELEGNAK